jgi:hypothetical protein
LRYCRSCRLSSIDGDNGRNFTEEVTVRFFLIAFAVCVGFSSPAWADGALAMGYTADGSVVWGCEFGHKSVEEAKPKALQYCQSRGSDCTLVRQELYGDGAWVAIALDQTVPAPQRLPFGEHYSSSKDKAAEMAIAACGKDGGRHCKVVFLKQNTKVITYRVVPGGGGNGNSTVVAPNFGCPPGQKNINTGGGFTCWYK